MSNCSCKYRDPDINRQTGRSTIQRLSTLIVACQCPNKYIEYQDHLTHTLSNVHIFAKMLKDAAKSLNIPAVVTIKKTQVFIKVTPKAKDHTC